MLNLVKAEALKLRHTFGACLPVTAPAATLCLVLPWASGMGSAMFAGIWNWWYTLLMPGMLAILCYLGMKRDKKMNYYNVFFVPVPVCKCLMGKIVCCALGLLCANFLVFAGTWISGAAFGFRAPVGGGFCAFLLLSVTSLWEIPLYLLLSARFGMFASIFSCMALQIGAAPVLAGTALWWVCPAAIPVRLMCPVLGILPNGLAVPADSRLWDIGVILPGILLSLVWFAALAILTLFWFRRKAVSE